MARRRNKKGRANPAQAKQPPASITQKLHPVHNQTDSSLPRSADGTPAPMALGNPSGMPFDGSDFLSQQTQDWMPMLWSGDTVVGYQRDSIVSRTRDLVRNDGWVAGAADRVADSTIGVSLRPISKPNWRALRAMTGNKSFDAVWAREYASQVDMLWQAWANSPGNYNDAERQLTFGQQMRLAFKSLIIDGDALAIIPFMEDRIGYGRARYGTCVQIVDTDRLSNPDMLPDESRFRNGIEIDPLTGEPLFYWVRQGHFADWWAEARAWEWKAYPREDITGRRIVAHVFDRWQPGQHRGGAGIFTPVMTKLKMLFRYDSAELEAAIINATFANFVRTPFDPQMTAEALGTERGTADWGGDWEDRLNWNQHRNLSIQNSRLPMLLPGEEIQSVSAARPASQYADFADAVLRQVAAAVGMASHELSNNYSDVNYSSARAAVIDARKTMDRRRQDFEQGMATPIRLAWLEEAFEADNLPLPHGHVPDFAQARHEYGRARWLGPAQGWVDPVKEKQGAILGIQAGFSSLEMECAKSEGLDWEEVLEQRAEEVARMKELGLPMPDWANDKAVTPTVTPPGPQDNSPDDPEGSDDPDDLNDDQRTEEEEGNDE